jgi:hypothetical protein
MVELLATLIVPPIVGLVLYYLVRRLWERDESRGVEGHDKLVTIPAPTIAPSETDATTAAGSLLSSTESTQVHQQFNARNGAITSSAHTRMLTPEQRVELESLGPATVRTKLIQPGQGRGRSPSRLQDGDTWRRTLTRRCRGLANGKACR